ncbi:MAG: helix-turn-helix domain-containing protein [Anaerolineales bacterium]
MKNSSIRKQIFEYLQHHQAATVSTLSRALGVTIPDIHYHLKQLLEERIIVASKSPEKLQQGRPELYYHLSPTAVGSNYEKLSETFLAFVANISPDTKQKSVLRQLAWHFTSPINLPESSLERLANVVKILQQWDYQPGWEAHKDGPRIYLKSCPYASLVNKYPLLCNLDQYILEELTGFSAKMIRKIDFRTPYTKCVFTLVLTTPES